MAGILEKNKRLIDYKLTEFGRDKLSEGSLSLKYYTFSDASIAYEEDLDSLLDFKVSSLSNYLPFEVDTNVTNIINPEYTLSSMLSFDDLDRNILFSNKEQNSTLSDHLINLKLLDNKNLLESVSERKIVFSYELNPNREEFDFKNNSSTYSTIKFSKVDLRDVAYICKDKRFLQKTRNKYLPPKNSFKSVEIEDQDPETFQPIEFLFKSFNTHSKIPEFLDRNEFIADLTNLLSKEKNIFKLEYILDEDKMSNEDVYLFELHKLISIENEATKKLQKISFIDLGEFYDKKEYTFKKVYLAGKIFLTRNIKDEINSENLRKRFHINNDYSFVNMFIMVVE